MDLFCSLLCMIAFFLAVKLFFWLCEQADDRRCNNVYRRGNSQDSHQIDRNSCKDGKKPKGNNRYSAGAKRFKKQK